MPLEGHRVPSGCSCQKPEWGSDQPPTELVPRAQEDESRLQEPAVRRLRLMGVLKARPHASPVNKLPGAQRRHAEERNVQETGVDTADAVCIPFLFLLPAGSRWPETQVPLGLRALGLLFRLQGDTRLSWLSRVPGS